MRSPCCLCISVSSPIVIVGKYVPVAANTIEDMLNTVFSSVKLFAFRK
jgi:hypothetical protein